MGTSYLDILIVEDNPADFLFMETAILEMDHPVKYKWLASGEDIRSYLFDHSDDDRKMNPLPKLIFMDLKLPKYSGLEILEMIKANKDTKEIRVYIVSHSKLKSDHDIALGLGAEDFIIKLLNLQDFMSSVQALIKKELFQIQSDI